MMIGTFLLRRPKWLLRAGILLFFLGTQASADWPNFPYEEYGLTPSVPQSQYVNLGQDGIDPEFCSEWNPEFAFRGYQCCPTKPVLAAYKRRKGRGRRFARARQCAAQRIKLNYCDEMTDEQRLYIKMAKSDANVNILALLNQAVKYRRVQSYCSVNDGFLAWGRPILSTSSNRLIVKSEARCENFGTDPMAAMMEWLGQQVGQQYSGPDYQGVRLLVGGVSAPKGGCITGYSGKRGHKSHTSGRDVDMGFLSARVRQPASSLFSRDFDAKVNWWLIRKIFGNPYACVKVIFLDKKHINKLAKVASGDPEWPVLRNFVKHIKGHRDHFHVRIGDGPGKPGCHVKPGMDLDDLDEESGDDSGDSSDPGEEFQWEAPLQMVDADLTPKQDRVPAGSAAGVAR